MKLLYDLSIFLYKTMILLASPFNQKAKLWINGRKNIFEFIDSKIKNETGQVIWFHCASLGEFEQGRPVIEKIKETDPKAKVVLTFFSPSGYEIRKNYAGADYIFYLPIDTVSNAKKFVQLIKPKKVFFVKYEFWFNYLNELKKNNIPTYLISGIFRKEQHFFKPYGEWFRQQLTAFSHFFVQNENSKELLKNIGFNNITVSGDSRFDRVFQIAEQTKEFEIVKSFCSEKNILIAGSTWAQDEKIISQYQYSKNNFKLIIAPHEVDENHIENIEQLFSSEKTIRYSKAEGINIKEYTVLIIDNIGMLSSLYKYGTIAYIGGGFGSGIHNILEPATFGLPVIFGPKYQKFSEAIELIILKGAFSINNENEWHERMNYLNHTSHLKESSEVCKNYVSRNTGATELIVRATMK